MGFVALEAINFLTGNAAASVLRQFLRYNPASWVSKRFSVSRMMNCSRCFPEQTGNVLPTSLPALYEEYVSFPSARLTAAHKTDRETASYYKSLAREGKRLHNSPQFPLSGAIPTLNRRVLEVLSQENAIGTEAFALKELAAVLLLMAGLRKQDHVADNAEDQKVQRWTATGGNLGSVEIHLAVRSLEGLPTGFYFYQPFENSLALVRKKATLLEVESFIARATGSSDSALPDVLLIFTGAFHRTVKKYGPFAYRLLHLDAGVALAQMQLVARSLDLRVDVAPQWADDLCEECFFLEKLQEQTTAVVGLSKSSRPAALFGQPGRWCGSTIRSQNATS